MNIQFLTFDLGVRVTENIAQYPIHHLTYSDTKFKLAMSNGLRGAAFTRKYIICMTFDFGIKVIPNNAQYPLRHHVTYSGT